MKVDAFQEGDAPSWDDMVQESPMGTFLHTRRFLSYHGDRFEDVSIIIRGAEGEMIGVLPAAVDPEVNSRVVSHPGLTYGALVHNGQLYGERMVEALSLALQYYHNLGFKTLIYKAVPYVFHRMPSGDDLYALFRIGGVRYRCDLSTVIDLDNRGRPKERRRRGLKKALREGIVVETGMHHAPEFWGILEDNLTRRHGKVPVHSLTEIDKLGNLFPENIDMVVGCYKGHVVGGTVLFDTGSTSHAQYIASSPLGNELSVLDAVFESCIERARNRGKRYVSFGVSTEKEGNCLNNNLYQFKREFGGGGLVHEFYQVDLGRL